MWEVRSEDISVSFYDEGPVMFQNFQQLVPKIHDLFDNSSTLQ